MAVGFTTLGITFGVYTFLSIVIFSLFQHFRTNKLTKKFYRPKRYIEVENREKPEKLSKTPFVWIYQIIKYSDEKVISIVGEDALVVVRLIRFALFVFILNTVLATIFVIPVNVTDENIDIIRKDETDESEVTDVDNISINNIEESSSRLWMHLCYCYLLSLVVINMVKKFHIDNVKLYGEHIVNSKNDLKGYTALIKNIPGPFYGTFLHRLTTGTIMSKLPTKFKNYIEKKIEEIDIAIDKNEDLNKVKSPNQLYWDSIQAKLRSGKTVKDVVSEEFNNVYGEDNVKEVQIVCNQKKIEKIHSLYENLKIQIEDLIDHYYSLKKRNKEIKRQQVTVIGPTVGEWATEKYGVKPVKVDKLDFYEERFIQLKKELDEKKEECLEKETSTALITFKSRFHKVVASTSMHYQSEDFYTSQSAPEPRDIIWENLTYRTWEETARQFFMWFLFILMLAFYIIPVSAVQALINLDQWEDKPVLKELLKVQFIESLLTGIIPGLALKIFIAIVPLIIKVMNRFEGADTHSKVEFGLIRKYFIFQFFVIFCYQVGLGGIANQYDQFTDNPSGIIDILAKGVPQQATFFLTYIGLNGLVVEPIRFLRVDQFVLFKIKSYLQSTERSKNRLWQNQELEFGYPIVNNIIVMMIGIVFSSIQPLIAPVCLVYFMIIGVMWKYDILYVKREKFQTGGKMWEIVFHQIMFSLVLQQFVTIGILSLKKFEFSFLITPLILWTAYSWYKMYYSNHRPLNTVSLHTTSQTKDDLTDAYEKDAYLSPVFKVSDDEYETIIKEIKNCKDLLEDKVTPEIYRQISNNLENGVV